MTFRTETEVKRTDEGEWSARVHDSWDIMGNTNGGYLLAIAARAMTEHVGRPDPVSVTGHYLAPGAPGEVYIGVEPIREGRTFAVAGATMRSSDRDLLTVLGSFADLAAIEGPERIVGSPPDLPPPEECVAIDPTETLPPPMMGKVELRIPGHHLSFFGGEKSGEALIEGWFRMRDREPFGSLGLIVALDAFPPTIFNIDLPVAWTPTLEFTCHVRRRPATEWIRCRFTTRYVSGGFLEEDGEAWDADGNFLAQSRQLALVPR